MKKLFFAAVVLFSLGFLFVKATGLSNLGNLSHLSNLNQDKEAVPKKVILTFALVADSHNDNANLKKALDLAKQRDASFVIGLGDWSDIGTMGELAAAKKVFDESGLRYYVTAGDHDLWDSRSRGEEAITNYRAVFGNPSRVLDEKWVKIVLLDNSDIYRGIDSNDWQNLVESLKETERQSSKETKLTFVMAHKAPFHPQSAHVMGSENGQVADQANRLIELIEENKVDGFFSGDLHFFAGFSTTGGSASGGHSPGGVKITTIGAISSERNFQGPRFAQVSVFSDYSWEVEDIEVR